MGYAPPSSPPRPPEAIPLSEALGRDVFEETKRRQKAFYFKNVWRNPHVGYRWDDEDTTWSEVLYLNAESYQPRLLFPELSTAVYGTPSQDVYAASGCGRYGYANRLLPSGQRIPLRHGKKVGEVHFDDNVVIPTLFDVKSGQTLKSLTPQTLLTLRPGLRKAKGTVVVAGLANMGWLLRKVCEKPSVTKVIVIEPDASLVTWFGDKLCKTLPKIADLIINKEPLTAIGKHGAKTRYLYDIWYEYGAAREDVGWRKALSQAEHVWGWGDVKV